RIAGWIGSGGQLLIGVDTQKDSDIIEAAYNDEEGVTAAFNLNILAHLNEALGANCDLSNWKHQAKFNADESCIEMHLVSRRDQDVEIQGEHCHFARGETIHTEYSYKYSPEAFQKLAEKADFEC